MITNKTTIEDAYLNGMCEIEIASMYKLRIQTVNDIIHRYKMRISYFKRDSLECIKTIEYRLFQLIDIEQANEINATEKKELNSLSKVYSQYCVK